MPISDALQARLNANQVYEGSPGWQIVDNANLGEPQYGNLFQYAPEIALSDLMQSYYNYGRGHWQWITAGNQAVGNQAMLRNAALTACACGTFNADFRWLATTILGIQNVVGADLQSQFITAPGSIGIDSGWPGNVYTDAQGIAVLRCYKFQSHFWNVYNGRGYDACFNRTFFNHDFVYVYLDPSTPAQQQTAHRQGNALLTLRNAVPIAPNGGFAALMQGNQLGRGWGLMKLVSAADLAGLPPVM